MCFICIFKFSTEELRLATRLSLPQKEIFVVIDRGNREGAVHCFYCFSAKICLHPPSPSIENLQFSMKNIQSPISDGF